MKVASAIVDFVGDFSKVDAGLGAIPAGAQPIAKKVGEMFSKHIGAGIIAGGGAVSLLAGLGAGIAEPLERAQIGIKNAVQNSGKSWDDYKGKVDEAVRTNEKFGNTSQDTQEALAKLTVATGDPDKALQRLNETSDLAAFKHITLTEAASTLNKMYAGNGRAFKEFGINVKDNTKLINDAAKESKLHEAAVGGLTKAQLALSDLEARDAATGKPLTISQQQALTAAKKAVADATQKESDTSRASIDATAAASNATKDYGKIIQEQVIPKIKGLKEEQSQTFFGQMDAAKAHVTDFAAGIAKNAVPALTAIGPTMMTAGGLIESGALGMIKSGAKVALTWVADTAKFLFHQGVRLVSWLATNAIMVATAIATGIAAAAAFMLPLLPFILIGLAVAALVVLVVTHFDQIKAVVTTVVAHVMAFIDSAVSNIIGFFGRLPGAVGGFIMDILKTIGNFEVQALRFFGGIVDKIVGFFMGIPGRLLSLGSNILHTIGQAFAGAAQSIPVIGGALSSFLQSFAEGGVVQGARGAPTLVVAHGGERVLTEAQQERGMAASGNPDALTAEGLRAVLTDMERERLQRPVVMDKNALLRAFGSLMADFDNGNKRTEGLRPA